MASYEIFVTYKKGIFDPPGATAEAALKNLGYDEVDERQDRQVHPARRRRRRRRTRRSREMCDKLLANPVIEDYRIVAKEA